jgi:rod shape-determining protein MreC
MLCGGLIVASRAGLLSPLEGIVSIPLNAVSGLFNRVALSITNTATEVSQIETLRQRNADLEEALAQFQAEIVELREIASDYDRLTELLDYTTGVRNQQTITADVVAIDQLNLVRTIVLNRGARDGVAAGMPVVTRQGLIGRVINVTANASRVLLVTDTTSAISARLQSTRVEGSVIGQVAGGLRMTYMPLTANVQEGDLAVTSGLGGGFPADIPIGQVISVREEQSELYKEAEIRSLVDFSTLEFVLIVTSFQPVDVSAFEGS